MRRFLILKLQGPMQAWGDHTYEDYRPTMGFPSRSGLLGLLGACLGIRRNDQEGQRRLSQSLRFAVRLDGELHRFTDFHTVLDARKVGGKVNEHPVVSRREYLVPAGAGSGFSVAVWETQFAEVALSQLVQAIRRPVFTPFLGRRACPLARPLYESELEAIDAVAALAQVPPVGGTIYCEEGSPDLPQMRVRDEPIISRPRQFESRRVYIHKQVSGGAHVPEQS
jgi:CRISPR system Cascade subunit CasD